MNQGDSGLKLADGLIKYFIVVLFYYLLKPALVINHEFDLKLEAMT
jgi:hypothetical protein